VVNCAGRTRSIIGAQSLINAKLPNRVVALENGTMGWELAGLSLAHGQTCTVPPPEPANLDWAGAAAADLARRRQLEPSERASLARFRLAERWGLGAADPIAPGKNGKPPPLLLADRDGLADRLRLGWMLTTPEALALIPAHDGQRLAGLDAQGRPFAPDRPRVALAPKLAALQALGLPQLLARFAAGETIAATDPAVIALHSHATTHRQQLAAAARLSPGELPSGTLRAFLSACGWKLAKAGRIRERGADRDVYTYTAQRVALPAGVDAQALAAAWLEALRRPAPAAGAKNAHTGKPYTGEKSPTPAQPPPPRPVVDKDIANLRRHYGWLKELEQRLIGEGLPSWLQ
jgi:hypothetical protein